jgi:hypothetical protein
MRSDKIRKAEDQEIDSSVEESGHKKARKVTYSGELFNAVSDYIHRRKAKYEIEKLLDSKGYYERAGLLLYKNEDNLSVLHRIIILPTFKHINSKVKAKKLRLNLIPLIGEFAKTLPREDLQSLIEARTTDGSTVLAEALKTGEIEVVKMVFALARDGLGENSKAYQKLLTAHRGEKSNLFHDAARYFSNAEGVRFVANEFYRVFGADAAKTKVYKLLKEINSGGFLPYSRSKDDDVNKLTNSFIDTLLVDNQPVTQLKSEEISSDRSHPSSSSSSSSSVSYDKSQSDHGASTSQKKSKFSDGPKITDPSVGKVNSSSSSSSSVSYDKSQSDYRASTSQKKSKFSDGPKITDPSVGKVNSSSSSSSSVSYDKFQSDYRASTSQKKSKSDKAAIKEQVDDFIDNFHQKKKLVTIHKSEEASNDGSYPSSYSSMNSSVSLPFPANLSTSFGCNTGTFAGPMMSTYMPLASLNNNFILNNLAYYSVLLNLVQNNFAHNKPQERER